MNLIYVHEQMRSKWGWEDGDQEPVNSYKVRDEIVKLINSRLPKECPVEAYGYNRLDSLIRELRNTADGIELIGKAFTAANKVKNSATNKDSE